MDYTVDEASGLLDIPRPTLYRYLRDYSVPHVRRQGRIYVPEDSFDRIREARDLHREGLGTQSVRRKLREGEELDARAVMERLDRITESLETLKAGGPDPAVQTLLARQSLLVSAVSDLTAMMEEILAANGRHGRRPKTLNDVKEEKTLVPVEREPPGGGLQKQEDTSAVRVRGAEFGALARRRRRRGALMAVAAILLCALLAATALGAERAFEPLRSLRQAAFQDEAGSGPSPPPPDSPATATMMENDRRTAEDGAEPGGEPAAETSAEEPGVSFQGVSEEERERISAELREARRPIDGYEGLGFWVTDLEDGGGYGVRPEKPFSGVRAVKAQIMVATYQRLEAGELSVGETPAITEEDLRAASDSDREWAVGDAWNIGDHLWMAAVESDPVAAGVLVRAAGGPEAVEGVARSLGAGNTEIGEEVAASTSTPRDVALVLEAVRSGRATPGDPQGGSAALLELLAEEEPGWEGGSGSPGVAAVVGYAEQPYVVAVFGEGGDGVREALGEISEAVWEVQNPGARPGV